MAERSKTRELPPLVSSKSSGKKRRETSSSQLDDSALLQEPAATRRNRKKASSQTTGKPKNSPTTAPNSLGDDGGGSGINNPGFNNSNNRDLPGSKKKKRTRNSEGAEFNSTHSLQSDTGRSLPLSGAEMSESNINPTSKTKKKRRRKSSSNLTSGKIESLGVDLADIQDDIIENGTDAETDSNDQVPQVKSHMKSQPIGKHFIEQSRGFKSTEKRVVDELYSAGQLKKEQGDEEQSYPVTMSSMAFALTSVQAFKTFSHFCMGILAGLAIWQTLYAFTFTNQQDTAPFLEIYQYISVPINCVFYIGLVFCTVATFDRYDVSKVTRPCLLKACTLQSGAVAALLYTTALCVNVSLAPMDDRLGPRVNGTFDTLRDFTDKQEETRHLNTWRILILVRAVLIGLAWFIISLRPMTDRLSKNMGKSEVTWGDDTSLDTMRIKRQSTVSRA